MRRTLILAVLLLAGASSIRPLHALSPCLVPGTYASLQQAVDDPSCTAIQLGAQTFNESVLVQRTVAITGDASGSSKIAGSFAAAGSGAVVTLSALEVANGCPQTLTAQNGAQIVTGTVVSTHSSALGCSVGPAGGRVFRDGFESGGTGSWSFSRP